MSFQNADKSREPNLAVGTLVEFSKSLGTPTLSQCRKDGRTARASGRVLLWRVVFKRL